MADVYNPSDGLNNVTVFPSKPGSGAAARKQVQDMLDQILAFHNAHIADLVTDTDGAHGLKIESGTFTPTIAGSTTAGTNTYSYQQGQYYKIGNLVYFAIFVALSAKDASMAGYVLIKNLPFAISSAAQVAFTVYGSLVTLSTNYTELQAYSQSGLNYIYLAQSGSGQPGAFVDAASISETVALRISGCYKA